MENQTRTKKVKTMENTADKITEMLQEIKIVNDQVHKLNMKMGDLINDYYNIKEQNSVKTINKPTAKTQFKS